MSLSAFCPRRLLFAFRFEDRHISALVVVEISDGKFSQRHGSYGADARGVRREHFLRGHAGHRIDGRLGVEDFLGRSLASGDETVVGHIFVAYEEVERVEYVALYRVLAEHEQVAEHELGIPARLGVDLVKGLGHGFAAALYLYGLSLFPLVGGLRHGDLSGQDKGRAFSVDSGGHDDGGLLHVGETEVIGEEKENEDGRNDQIVSYGISAMHKLPPFSFFSFSELPFRCPCDGDRGREGARDRRRG